MCAQLAVRAVPPAPASVVGGVSWKSHRPKKIGKHKGNDHEPFVCGCGVSYKRKNDGSASKSEEEHKKKCRMYQRQGIASFSKKASQSIFKFDH